MYSKATPVDRPQLGYNTPLNMLQNRPNEFMRSKYGTVSW